jgi:hypothetical protein
MKYDNEMASAGGTVAFVILILVCGFLTAILGMGVDTFVATHNGMIGASPTSADSINTGINLVAGFKAMAFLLMLAVGINYISVAQQEGGDA